MATPTSLLRLIGGGAICAGVVANASVFDLIFVCCRSSFTRKTSALKQRQSGQVCPDGSVTLVHVKNCRDYGRDQVSFRPKPLSYRLYHQQYEVTEKANYMLYYSQIDTCISQIHKQEECQRKLYYSSGYSFKCNWLNPIPNKQSSY